MCDASTKTVCMHFCPLRKLHHEPELNIYGNQIPVVKEYTFLGVLFDSKLSFILHKKYVKKMHKSSQSPENSF